MTDQTKLTIEQMIEWVDAQLSNAYIGSDFAERSPILTAIRAALAERQAVMESDDDNEMLQLVDERDAAEEALSQAYYLITGESPEWSNNFGHKECLEEIKDACSVLKQAVMTDKQAKP